MDRSLPVQLAKWAILIGFNLVGFVGFLLIIYGFLHAADPQRYSLGLIDDTAPKAAQIITVLGVFITAYSIYFPMHVRLPHPASQWVVVPLIVTPLLLYGLYQLLWVRPLLPELVVNGFAIMGLTGAILRLLPFADTGFHPVAQQQVPAGAAASRQRG